MTSDIEAAIPVSVRKNKKLIARKSALITESRNSG